MSQTQAPRNAVSVDLEDYFHPSEVQPYVAGRAWDSLPSRVEESTALVLDLFASRNVRATFFVLGAVAHRHPALIRKVATAGHEIACHSYAHRLVYEMTPDEFLKDTQLAVKVIEDACGVTPRAYRAPSYSITSASIWALEILASCGFTRDSSIYPIRHDRYGIPDFPRHATKVDTAQGSLLEIPISTVRLGEGRVTPVGGGAYLRILPYRYTAAGVRRINQDEQRPACIYFHPWEVDPQQPRLATGLIASMRTYLGLRGMAAKIGRLLDDFQFGPVGEVFPIPAPDAASQPVYAR